MVTLVLKQVHEEACAHSHRRCMHAMRVRRILPAMRSHALVCCGAPCDARTTTAHLPPPPGTHNMLVQAAAASTTRCTTRITTPPPRSPPHHRRHRYHHNCGTSCSNHTAITPRPTAPSPPPVPPPPRPRLPHRPPLSPRPPPHCHRVAARHHHTPTRSDGHVAAISVTTTLPSSRPHTIAIPGAARPPPSPLTAAVPTATVATAAARHHDHRHRHRGHHHRHPAAVTTAAATDVAAIAIITKSPQLSRSQGHRRSCKAPAPDTVPPTSRTNIVFPARHDSTGG